MTFLEKKIYILYEAVKKIFSKKNVYIVFLSLLYILYVLYTLFIFIIIKRIVIQDCNDIKYCHILYRSL